MNAFLLRLVTLFLGLWAVVATAQPVEPHVSVRFTVVGWGEETSELFYLQGGKPTDLVIPEVGRSRVYAYSGPPTLTLMRRIPAATAGDIPAPAVEPPAPVPLAKVTFDPAVKKSTVLLLKTGARVEAFIIPDDEEVIPVGRVLLLNLTPLKLAVRCNGKDIVMLDTRQRKLAPSGGVELELDAEVVQERAADQWRRVARSYFPVIPDDQTLILFLPGESGRDAIRYVVLRQKTEKSDPDAAE